MKKIFKNAIFYTLVFAFIFLGAPALAEASEELTREERVEILFEQLEKLVEAVEEMRDRGELPIQQIQQSTCDHYLTEYIRYGANNNPEQVKKLQSFLNEHEGESIPVTGFYGEITLAAVNRLQTKHASEILTPWGITEPTGYVYITTQRFINDKKCGGTTLPMPELVADTTPVETQTPNYISREDTEGEEGSEWIDENWEELSAEDEEEEKEKKNNLTWIVIILGSIGLGIVIYNIYTFKPRNI